MLMNAQQSCLLIIDIQERLAPAVMDPDQIIATTDLLIAAARRLEVPVLATEQYPKGLGPTVSDLAGVLRHEEVVEKTTFSAMAAAPLAARLQETGAKQILVCGMEAHVCVLQTVFDLLAAGYQSFAVIDAISSRRRESHAAAVERMRQAGAQAVTAEMVVFEWLGEAGTPAFKELSARLR